jgi:hypothetical protein
MAKKRAEINIDNEAFRLMDTIKRNSPPIKEIELWIMQKSKGWDKQSKNLFRKRMKEVLYEYFITNKNYD